MKHLKLIKSMTDVITNSSTEVFVTKINEEFLEEIKSLKYLDIILFNTEDDVKNFIFPYVSGNVWPLYDLFETDIFNPLTFDFFESLLITLSEKPFEYDYEKIYKIFKPVFIKLLGHAVCLIEDNYCDIEAFIERDYMIKKGYFKQNE